MVRVCVIDDKSSIHIILKRGFKIYTMDFGRVLMEGPSLKTDIIGTREGIRIAHKDVKTLGLRIKVSKDSSIYIEGKRFRGELEVVKKENSRLMAVNHIMLEDYLYGVLYHEVSHRWPMEVLKAQAIAARTFALYQARQNKLQPYDLRSDVYSQVYGGSASERWATTKAVDMTKGEILVYKGDILPAYYHATCAGFTESAANLWNVDLLPLKGVQCNYCQNSPHYRWAKWIPIWSLENTLKQATYKMGRISALNVLSKNASGRIDKLEIKDEAGVAVILTGKEFRQLMGPNEIRSTNFDVTSKWGQLIFSGYGWGHGVGMCQWGAYEMARQGKKAEEILSYYYPGAEITTIDKLKQ